MHIEIQYINGNIAILVTKNDEINNTPLTTYIKVFVSFNYKKRSCDHRQFGSDELTSFNMKYPLIKILENSKQ